MTTAPPALPVPQVSVVVPFYERQDRLDRLTAGLDVQTMEPHLFELVVADDGSRQAPVVSERPYAVTVVRQRDEGFRLGAARNLGARSARGELVVFLDQDCVPTPGYLQQVRDATRGEWDLSIGHRLHADLDGFTPEQTRLWMTGAGDPPPLLDEPGWLLEAYARTADLTRPDHRAYQLVIGAVTSLHRRLLDRLGGFDETMTAYGGEDWDLGHRALVAGADARWLPDAVVWHDGPDLPARGGWTQVKNAETLTLARRIPDRDVRGEHLVWSVPDVVVRLDARGAGAATVVASVESLLAGSDAHIWLGPPGADVGVVGAVLEDPRVHLGEPGSDVMSRARWLVDCPPVLLEGATLRMLTAHAPVEGSGLRLVSMREENRAARGIDAGRPGPLPAGVRVHPLAKTPVLERLWQSRPGAQEQPR